MALSAEASQARPGPLLARVRWPSSLTFPLLLLLIIICFYWKLVFTYQFDWVWGPDLSQQILPWWEEEARQLQQGHFPLWDTHSWMGQPFLGQAQPGAGYPLNWLLWLMPQDRGHIAMWALQWYCVAFHYMAALFSYLLCRDLKRSRGASLVAGLAFSLAGYVGWTDWPQMVNGAVWTPLVFLFLLRAVRNVNAWASASLCGVCLGISWLSGHHQAPIFLTLASGGTWLYYILKDGRPDWRIARLAATAMIFAPIVGALQILPAQEFGRLAWRWAGTPNHLGWDDVIPYYVHADHALRPIYLFGILFPGFDNNAGPFLGVVAVSLALLGIAVYWRQHTVKLFSAIAAGGLIYSLGANSIFQGFIYAVVPFVEKARVPAMATLLFHSGFATLAAFGVDALRASPESDATGLIQERSAWFRGLNIAVLAFGLLTGAGIMGILLVKQFKWEGDDRPVMTFLCAMLLALLIYAWRTGNLGQRQAMTLLILLLLFELGNESSFMLADRHDWDRRSFIEKARGNEDIASFLHSQPGPFRVETATPDIVANWGDYHNIDFVRAQAGVTVNSFELEAYTPQTQRLLGVKYILARAPTAGDQREVFRGTSGIAVYENPAPFPRAWAVHEVLPVRSNQEERNFISGNVVDLQWKALLQGTPPRLACQGVTDKVAITGYQAENVSIDVIMTCDGMLVLSDTYYPGWNARVDGKAAQIYEVDLALRGVLAPKGTHTITFEYRPRSFSLGVALTLAGLLAAAVITIFSGKGSRQPQQ
jgi:hypothetical protein